MIIESTPNIPYNKLKREITSFVLIGITATLLDLTIYWWLHGFLTYSIAKGCSFFMGSAFVYLMNKFFTFQHKAYTHAQLMRFSTLYASSLFANVSVNSLCIMLIKASFPFLWHDFTREVLMFSFVVATGFSAMVNFIGQKFWVFRI